MTSVRTHLTPLLFATLAPLQALALPSNPCSEANFTRDRYAAIAPGMTLDQVGDLIGCAPSDAGRGGNTQRRLVTWAVARPSGSIASISVWFDTATWQASPIVNDMLKTGQGF